jgi:two-component system chemotaxis response regulator CheB
MELGALSPYTCPECHGVLSQIREGGILRFRCHTGHAYSAGVLLASLKENAENDLWSAVRSLEETVILTRHIAEHLAGAGRNEAARAALQEAALAERRSEQVRQIALDDGMAGEPARREA